MAFACFRTQETERTMSGMIGERLRVARQSQGRSLADIASKVKISVATLSRIETDKQSVDLGLFLSLARALAVPPNEFLEDGDGEDGGNDLARRIASLAATERADLWRELAAERRNRRAQKRGADSLHMSQHVEELLAQIDFLREELEAVRKRVRRR